MNKNIEKKEFKIPILTPLSFRNIYIKNKEDELLNQDNITDFFIHSLEEGDVKLNLPLPPHKKTVNDFVFITGGTMVRNLGIESYQLGKYDFLITPKNKITTTEFVSSDLEGFFCHFSDDFIGANPFFEALHTQPLVENLIQVSENEAHNLKNLLTRVLQLFNDSKSNKQHYRLIASYLSIIFSEVFLLFKTNRATPHKSNDILLNFKDLIYKQFKQHTTIREYASQLNITPNYLNKIVKYETGKTTTDLIHEIIILETKVLLFQTKLTINEISLELGFEDPSYFSRFFKNKTGLSPSKFRMMIDLS